MAQKIVTGASETQMTRFAGVFRKDGTPKLPFSKMLSWMDVFSRGMDETLPLLQAITRETGNKEAEKTFLKLMDVLSMWCNQEDDPRFVSEKGAKLAELEEAREKTRPAMFGSNKVIDLLTNGELDQIKDALMQISDPDEARTLVQFIKNFGTDQSLGVLEEVALGALDQEVREQALSSYFKVRMAHVKQAAGAQLQL